MSKGKRSKKEKKRKRHIFLKFIATILITIVIIISIIIGISKTRYQGSIKSLVLDIVLIIMAYLIFAISLLGINMVKYLGIKLGLYILLTISGLMTIYTTYNFSKELK